MVAAFADSIVANRALNGGVSGLAPRDRHRGLNTVVIDAVPLSFIYPANQG